MHNQEFRDLTRGGFYLCSKNNPSFNIRFIRFLSIWVILQDIKSIFMEMKTGLIKEIEHEAKSTRRMLERIPLDQLNWKPHDKSMDVMRLTKDLESADNELLMKPWTMREGEKVYMTMPKAAVVRNMALNHSVHHRGQLSVYLRLLNVPVPGMYGPTADEAM